MKSFESLWKFCRSAYKKWRSDNCSLVAAGLSFYAIFSVVPLMLVTVAIVGRVYEQSQAKSIVLERVEGVTSPEAAMVVESFLRLAGQTAIPASFVGTLLLLWASSRLFAELQQSLNIIWESTPIHAHVFRRILDNAFKRLRAIAVTVALGVCLIIFSLIDVGLAWLKIFLNQYYPTVLMNILLLSASTALSIVLVSVVLALIYKWLPAAKIGWKEVWTGALLTALFFVFGRYLISFYFHYSNVATPFGAAGSAIVVLLWIYFSMQIFLFGAEFTWVYGNRDKQS